jgi:ATP-dependent Clp protease protease subunit
MTAQEIQLGTVSPDNNIDDYNIWSSFRLFILGEIKIDSSREIVEQLYNIDDLNKTLQNPKPIKLIINSPGGDLYASQMICDVISEIETPVHCHAYGQACSGGLIIFMAGEKGYRCCTKKTQFMSHRFSTEIGGSHTELQNHTRELDRIYNRLLNHYQECTGLTKKRIEKELLPARDVWLDADTCKKLNIVDQIIGN